MTELLTDQKQHHGVAGVDLPTALRSPRPEREAAERGARASMRRQIAKLERDLGSLAGTAFPRQGFDFAVPAAGPPRLLGLGELEELRDDLAARVEEVRLAVGDQRHLEQRNRARLEAMFLDPGAHRWERISAEDIGEPGCAHYHVRPRLGLVGLLGGWWRVRISSGCPLARGRGRRP